MDFNSINCLLRSLNNGDRVVIPGGAFGVIQHHAIYLETFGGPGVIIHMNKSTGLTTENVYAFFSSVDRVLRIEKFMYSTGYSIEILWNRIRNYANTEYDLLTNNCETFANYIQHGVHRSGQVTFWISAGVITTVAVLIINNATNKDSA